MAESIIGPYFIAPPRDICLSGGKGPGPGGKAPAPREKSGRDMGAIAARTAERFVGIPYQWGGDNVVEGMDCSGFVRAVYNLCGVNIPRTSGEQFRTGDSVGRNSLKDGDLVFFGASENAINHVGIYVGNNRFVHAPRRGDDIKISSLDDHYYDKKFVGAKRYF
jgi:cell wall-associated NlpC family hydrolase